MEEIQKISVHDRALVLRTPIGQVLCAQLTQPDANTTLGAPADKLQSATSGKDGPTPSPSLGRHDIAMLTVASIYVEEKRVLAGVSRRSSTHIPERHASREDRLNLRDRIPGAPPPVAQHGLLPSPTLFALGLHTM